MELHHYIKDRRIIVQKGNFAIIKAKTTDNKAFAQIVDREELTLIIEHSFLIESNIIEIEDNLKILTFDIGCDTHGILSEITALLSAEQVSVFVLSSFSADHVIVREKDFNKVINKFSRFGFSILNIQ
jgi:hypothetical protein